MTDRRFLVCVHDATAAYARETRVLIRGLAPLLGRRLSFGVVPDWHGEWPLSAHRDYCRMVQEGSEELLLHGYRHQRQRGWGLTGLLAEGSDEMNGLGREETRRTLEQGQRVFADVFGVPARGFLAPAWQRGQVYAGNESFGLDYVVGFFSLDSRDGHRVPLTTWTWDCGRWAWLGQIGHGIGGLLNVLDDRRVPALAIHPRDLERGFWPKILRLIEQLLDNGYEPSTAAQLLEAERC